MVLLRLADDARTPPSPRWFVTGHPTRADRLRSLGEGILPFAVAGLAWELFARLGPFPPKLFPSLATVARTFVDLVRSGILVEHTLPQSLISSVHKALERVRNGE